MKATFFSLLFFLFLNNTLNPRLAAGQTPPTTTVSCLGCTVRVHLPPPVAPLPSPLPRVHLSVGASGVYLTGTTLGQYGSGSGEANVEFVFPLGRVRWFEIIGQASFGGASGVLSGSGSVGLGFVLNGDSDIRPLGSTRLSTLFTTRGRGTGDSQDLLTLGGKLQINVSLGTTAGVQWNYFLACEAGSSIYKDADGRSHNDGWYVAPSTGLLLRL